MTPKYDEKNGLKYYEGGKGELPLVLLHSPGVDGRIFGNVERPLAKKFHLFSIDCPGHGGSVHEPEKYNVREAGMAIISFIENTVGKKVRLLGHSTGGIIAGFAAANSDLVEKLVLEDVPFFSSEGERRRMTYNFVDIATVSHNFLAQDAEKDFICYYFENQFSWQLIKQDSAQKMKSRLMTSVRSLRKRHPERDLKLPFWPKASLAGFQGMQDFDPRFGDALYDDSFNAGIPHEQILKNIGCETIFMKAKSEATNDGILATALSEEDISRVQETIPKCAVWRYTSGHGIHIEQPDKFVEGLMHI